MIRRLFVTVILTVTAFSATARGEACPGTPKSFETLLDKYVNDWTGDPEFCQFQRFLALNEMISADMLGNAKRYNERMQLLVSRAQSEPIEYLLLGLQESWFRIFINHVLDREQRRVFESMTDWRVLTGAAVLIGVSLTKPAKRIRTKVLRFAKRGLRYVLRRPPIVVTSTATNMSRKETMAIGEGNGLSFVFVKPPLFFLASDEASLDPRTDGVFVNNILNDLWEVGGAVAVGTGAGIAASSVATNRLGWSSWSAFSRGSWTQKPVARFANPAFFLGLAVSFGATHAAGVGLEKVRFAYDFKNLSDKLAAALEDLRLALRSENEFSIWIHSQKVKNTLILYRYWLVQELDVELLEITDDFVSRVEKVLADCRVSRDHEVSALRARFGRRVAKAVSYWDRNLRSAILLAQNVERLLLDHPHRMTEEVLDFSHTLMNEDRRRLDSRTISDELWTGISSQVGRANGACVGDR